MMSEMADRGRRRRRRGGRREYGPDKAELPLGHQPTYKPPIILAKPPSDRTTSSAPRMGLADRPPDEPDYVPSSQQAPRTMLVLKSREEPARNPVSGLSSSQAATASIPSLLASDGPPTYQIQRHPTTPTAVSPAMTNGGSASRLAPAPEMTSSVRLIDESFVWCDSPLELLLDQTDFLTVGVLGSQGVGKSTLMSIIAGNTPSDSHKSFVLRPQTKEVREVGGHQTLGVDLFVTAERVLFLDTQAVLSSSILDHVIHHEKKFATDYSSAENCLEMQSLMIATFMLTVCNVVVVVMDWFVDFDILRFLQTAEMLKPATPGHDSSSTEESPEHFPHLVFVLNKANRDDFSAENYEAMRNVLHTIFAQSKLKFKGGVSLASTGAIPGVRAHGPLSDVNLFLLPNMHSGTGSATKNHAKTDGGVKSLLPAFCGHPTFDHLVRMLRNSVLSMPRSPLTHTTLSEKNWFHYAARTWEAIKKSQLLAEYNRLLP